MNTQKIKIPNRNGELLDTWIEGNDQAQESVIIAHGLGTNKHETASFFDDIVEVLSRKYRLIRFDFSGYGLSEGKPRDASYAKHSEDLNSVINYVRREYGSPISIIAQSMGCFVTLTLQPQEIRKTVLTGMPNSNTEYICQRLQERIIMKGGKVDESGISIFPRTSGEVQEFGPEFWSDIRSTDPVKLLSKYIKLSDVLVIHPAQDEIVGNEFMEQYQKIPNVNWVSIPGDHSFKKIDERKNMINIILDFLKN